MQQVFSQNGVVRLWRMRDKLCSNPRSRTRAPEFMAVITGSGECARMVGGRHLCDSDSTVGEAKGARRR